MATPQAGIFHTETDHHYYLEYRLRETVDAVAIRNAIRAAHARVPTGMHVVFAFGRRAWDRVWPEAMPSALQDFASVGSGARSAPTTQRDLWIWLQGDGKETLLDAALALDRVVSAVATLEDEEHGFRRFEDRGFEGFIDGSENPTGDKARAAALIPEGEIGGGGSFVLTQRWVHDLAAFEALPTAAQEGVIGRTLAGSLELEGAAMPTTSHVSRTEASVEGVKQKIFRRSLPWGGVARQGLYFLAFACTPSRFEIQLERMYGTAGDALYDRITDFSQAVTGSYWFAPCQQELAAALATR
jgi:putative iron-dependent peroxidase